LCLAFCLQMMRQSDLCETSFIARLQLPGQFSHPLL
jgi:hypothetical protein